MPSQRKKPVKRKKSRSRKQQTRYSIRNLLLVTASILVLITTSYLFYLDQQIVSRMSGRIWSLPSHIYARPLELYQDKTITSKQLQTELNNTGYSNVNESPVRPGQYRVSNNNYFEIISREFSFPDGLQASAAVRIRLHANKVSDIHELYSDKAVGLFRLEPQRIAGIYPQQKEERQVIQLKQVPDDLILALLSVEDRRFYQHWGLDLRSIARAMFSNLLAGKTVQGGSTITQQLVKNLFLTPERTLIRKFKEALMAILLEIRYDKSDILEAYINEVYLGQNGSQQIHGFELASQFYFAQPLRKIRRDQMALLVGMVKGPSWYEPRKHPDRARNRRNQVLQVMAEQGVLTQGQLNKYMARSLGLSSKPQLSANRYPALIDLVKRRLHQEYKQSDLQSAGLRIFTSIDPVKQAIAETSVRQVLPGLETDPQNTSPLQVSVILASSHQGEIEAMVSDRQPEFAGFNRSLDAVRQIGSLIKPAIYLTALQQSQNYNLVSKLDNSPLHIQTSKDNIWSPQNYDRTFSGQMSLFKALRDSVNVPSVRLGLSLGLADISATLRNLGVTREIPRYPSMTLGAFNLSPMDIANMYQTFAANGFHVPLKVIRGVQTADGNNLRRYPIETHKTLDEKPLYLVNRTLHEVTTSGTAKPVSTQLRHRFAGKTGTTDDLRDSWFAGFSDDQLAVAWLGRDDNQSTGLTGSSGALRLWINMMSKLNVLDLDLTPPQGVELHWVDSEKGGLSDKSCQGAVELPFISGTAPTERVECKGGFFYQLKRLFN